MYLNIKIFERALPVIQPNIIPRTNKQANNITDPVLWEKKLYLKNLLLKHTVPDKIPEASSTSTFPSPHCLANKDRKFQFFCRKNSDTACKKVKLLS